MSTINVYEFEGSDYADRKRLDKEVIEKEKDQDKAIGQRARVGKRENTVPVIEKKVQLE